MDSSERTGCLLFAIPRALLGRRAPAALPDGIALPELDTTAADPADLPALVRARNAARQCDALLRKADLGSVATLDAGRELAGLVGRVYAMGPALKGARAFVQAHSPDRVARERADLELEMIGSSPAQIREMKQAIAALDERTTHAGSVQQEIDRLSARLVAAAAELEALHARLGASLGSPDLVHEVRAWHQSASLAMNAFIETVGELE